MQWSELIGARVTQVLSVPCDDADLTQEERRQYQGYWRPFLGLNDALAVEVTEWIPRNPLRVWSLNELSQTPGVETLRHEAIGRTITSVARDETDTLWVELSGGYVLIVDDDEYGTHFNCVELSEYRTRRPECLWTLTDL